MSRATDSRIRHFLRNFSDFRRQVGLENGQESLQNSSPVFHATGNVPTTGISALAENRRSVE
jgi:hypothetical protein